MADFRVNITADADDASRKVSKFDSELTNATRDRSVKFDVPNLAELNKGFADLDKNIKTAANNIKTLWKFADFVPGIGATKQLADNLIATGKAANNAGINVSSASKTLSSSVEVAARSTSALTDKLLNVGVSVYLVKQAVGALNAAFAGFFNQTIGREVKLRETILKTQTTLASTNKVISGGKEITDPYLKIVSLTGEISKHIDSIRERSLALAGVTSNEVIEVFGLVAQQVGQIGGGLKEAEDLAISFAGALGTFNIPLYQARQEIGSILSGTISSDSYLAKALSISNEDVAKAKTQIGGVAKFLQDRLAAAVAGQRIAAEGFAGVLSNIKDFQELLGQRFGAGLLDPLLDGLTKVYNFLFSIKGQLFEIASATGKIIGSGISTVFGQIQGRSKLAQGTESGSQQALKGAKDAISGAANAVQTAMAPVIGQLTTLLERAAQGIAVILKGLGALAKGFLSLQLSNLQAVIGALEALSQILLSMAGALGGVLEQWGRLLNVPIIQEFSRIQVIFGVITKTGIPDMIGKVVLLIGAFQSWNAIVPFVITQINAIRAIIGGIIVSLGNVITAFGNFANSMAIAASRGGAAMKALGIEMGLLSKEAQILGNRVQQGGNKLGGLGMDIEKVKGGLTGLLVSTIMFNIAMLGAIAVVSVLIDVYTRQKEKQDEIATDRRAEVALKRLATTYKSLGEEATTAQKRARDFEQALVDAQYSKGLSKLEEIREKINQIRYELKPGIGSWNEFWHAAAGNTEFEQRARRALAGLLEDEKKKKLELNKYAREEDKKDAAKDLELIAQRKKDLTKETAAFQRDHESKLFELRQQAASKEVEIFRAAGELRITEIERGNAKLLKGQEGASAVAIDALNKYLATRERGELEIEAAKQELNIEAAQLDKSVADYRYEIEKKIKDLRDKGAQAEKEAADARKTLGLGTAGTPESISAAVAATKDLTGINNQCAEAVKRFMTVIGVNSSVMTKAAASAEKMGTVMTDWSKLQPGDIVARGKQGAPDHVGVFTGGQNVFHQSSGANLTAGNYPHLGYFKQQGYFIRPTGMSGSTAPVQSASKAAATSAVGETPKIGSLDPKKLGNDIESATSRIKGLNARLADLKAQATNATTKAAFDAILDGLFPQVPIEAAQNDLVERFNKINAMLLSTGANTSASAAEQKFRDIKAETQTQIEILRQETKQVIDVVKARTKEKDPKNRVSTEEAKRIEDTANKRLKEEIKNREKVAILKRAAAAADNYQEALSQQQNLIVQFNQQTKAIQEEAAARKYANRLRMEGFSEEAIQNELRKLKLDEEFRKEAEALDAQYKVLTNSLQQYNLAQAAGGVLTDAQKLKFADLTKQLADLQAQRDGLDGKRTSAKTEGDAVVKAAQKTPREDVEERAGNIKKELKELTKWSSIVIESAQSIGSAFSNSFKGIINGSMNANQALGTFFQSIADSFLDMAAKMIAKWIEMMILNTALSLFPNSGSLQSLSKSLGGSSGSFFNFRASGGPVTSGSPYVVGEKGPELFVPSRSGTIVANDQIQPSGSGGMSITVNVDAKGTAVEGDDAKGAALGRVVSLAVQAELMKQRRPGGLLTSARG